MHTFNASMDSPPTPPHTFPHQKTTSLHKGEKAAWEWITEWFCSKYGTLCTAWILKIKPESPSFGKNCTAERFISLAKWEMIHMLEFHHLDVMKSLPPCLPQAPTSRFWENPSAPSPCPQCPLAMWAGATAAALIAALLSVSGSKPSRSKKRCAKTRCSDS